jgi:hypothetical protein
MGPTTAATEGPMDRRHLLEIMATTGLVFAQEAVLLPSEAIKDQLVAFPSAR